MFTCGQVPHSYQPSDHTYLLDIRDIFLGFPGPSYWDYVTPINWYQDLLNNSLWAGYVMKYTILSAVGNHYRKSSYFSIWSVMKYYLMFMWFVRLLLEDLPFFSKIVTLLLSLYTIFSKTSYPWTYNQYLVHSRAGMQSSTAKFSVSVEIFMFSFYFVELIMVNPLPIDRPPPVWPIVFGCNAIDPSIHHFSIPLSLALIISGRFLVPLIYFIRCTNLAQSSFSGSITPMVRNEILVKVSGMDRLVERIFLPPADETPHLVWCYFFTVFVNLKKNIWCSTLISTATRWVWFIKGIEYFIDIVQHIDIHLTKCGIF